MNFLTSSISFEKRIHISLISVHHLYLYDWLKRNIPIQRKYLTWKYAWLETNLDRYVVNCKCYLLATIFSFTGVERKVYFPLRYISNLMLHVLGNWLIADCMQYGCWDVVVYSICFTWWYLCIFVVCVGRTSIKRPLYDIP